MDTLRIHTDLDRQSTLLMAACLNHQQTTTGPSGSTSKQYGALTLSRPTLYHLNDSTFGSASSRLSLEFSAPVVMRGHNSVAFASEVCARMARSFVLDEIQGRTTLQLHDHPWVVSRLDVAFSWFGRQAAEYVTSATKYTLPRRTRRAYPTAVYFQAKTREELFYDKQASVMAEVSKRRKVEDVQPGLVSRAEGLAIASARVADGALRLECRLKKSTQIATVLGLARAQFDDVVRDEHAFTLLASFLAQFGFAQSWADPASVGDPDGGRYGRVVEQMEAAGYGGTRLLRVLGFQTLQEKLGGSEAAARALGLSAATRRSLTRDWLASGVERLGKPPHEPLQALMITKQDLANIHKIEEEEEQGTWQLRRQAWRRSWQLPAEEQELLADWQ